MARSRTGLKFTSRTWSPHWPSGLKCTCMSCLHWPAASARVVSWETTVDNLTTIKLRSQISETRLAEAWSSTYRAIPFFFFFFPLLLLLLFYHLHFKQTTHAAGRIGYTYHLNCHPGAYHNPYDHSTKLSHTVHRLWQSASRNKKKKKKECRLTPFTTEKIAQRTLPVGAIHSV